MEHGPGLPPELLPPFKYNISIHLCPGVSRCDLPSQVYAGRLLQGELTFGVDLGQVVEGAAAGPVGLDQVAGEQGHRSDVVLLGRVLL